MLFLVQPKDFSWTTDWMGVTHSYSTPLLLCILESGHMSATCAGYNCSFTIIKIDRIWHYCQLHTYFIGQYCMVEKGL